MIVLIDACHSDSMDKGTNRTNDTYRGTDEIFGSESMSDAEISALRDSYHNHEETALTESSDLSNVVYLSACLSDKRNYEIVVDGKGYGSLTYYFCEEYKNKGISDLPVFLSAIYYGMENNQTLKFHGQVPSIRNTIGWEAPSRVVTLPPKPPIGSGGNTGVSSYQTVIWCIVAASLILIFIILWITRKRTK